YVRERFEIDPSELGLRRILLGAEPGAGIPAVRDRLAHECGAFVTESLGNAGLIPTYSADCDELDVNHCLPRYFMVLRFVDRASAARRPTAARPGRVRRRGGRPAGPEARARGTDPREADSNGRGRARPARHAAALRDEGAAHPQALLRSGGRSSMSRYIVAV